MNAAHEHAAPDARSRAIGTAIYLLGIVSLGLGIAMIVDANGPTALKNQAWLGAFFMLIGFILLGVGRRARRLSW